MSEVKRKKRSQKIIDELRAHIPQTKKERKEHKQWCRKNAAMISRVI